MPTSRYARTQVIGSISYLATAQAVAEIREAIDAGRVRYREVVLSSGQRLDTIAGKEYEDGRYWWIIAAASSIGWGLQVPPGTSIKIPVFDDVVRYFA